VFARGIGHGSFELLGWTHSLGRLLRGMRAAMVSMVRLSRAGFSMTDGTIAARAECRVGRTRVGDRYRDARYGDAIAHTESFGRLGGRDRGGNRWQIRPPTPFASRPSPWGTWLIASELLEVSCVVRFQVRWSSFLAAVSCGVSGRARLWLIIGQ
jgi:hypothetical protein